MVILNDLVLDSDNEADDPPGIMETWISPFKTSPLKLMCEDVIVANTTSECTISQKFIPGNSSPEYINTASCKSFDVVDPVCSSPMSISNSKVDFDIAWRSFQNSSDLTIPLNDSGITVEKSIEIIDTDNESYEDYDPSSDAENEGEINVTHGDIEMPAAASFCTEMNVATVDTDFPVIDVSNKEMPAVSDGTENSADAAVVSMEMTGAGSTKMPAVATTDDGGNMTKPVCGVAGDKEISAARTKVPTTDASNKEMPAVSDGTENSVDAAVDSTEKPAAATATATYKKPARPCMFCDKMQTKLKRHILTKHKQHELVMPLLTLDSKEQDRLIATFRKNAIKTYNIQVADKGEDSFMRERKSETDEPPLMCSGCKAFIAKSYKARHQLKCPGNGSNFMIPVISINSIANTEQYSDGFKALLNTLQLDEVGTYIKTDELVLMIGARSYAAVHRKVDKQTEAKKSVRARMRLITRVYFEYRKIYSQQSEIKLENPMNNVGDLYRRETVPILGNAVISLCEKPSTELVKEGNVVKGSDCVTNLKSGLMISCLNMLKLTSKFLIGHFLVQNADANSKRVVDFLEVLKLYEHDYFDAAYYEINHRRNTTLRKPASLPKDDDVKALTQECERVMSSVDVYDFDSKAFIPVRSALATTLILFNARRGGEPVRLRIKQWEEALKGEWVEKVSDEEFNEETMLVTYQTGKGANHLVPVMFPPETLSAMKYLVDPDVRKKAGIRSSNHYIFATTNSDGHASGWHCINDMLKKLSLTGAINATTNRHRVASMLAQLDLTNKEKELIYKHFGHSGNINQNVYQAAAGTLQLQSTGKHLLEIQNKTADNDSPQVSNLLKSVFLCYFFPSINLFVIAIS